MLRIFRHYVPGSLLLLMLVEVAILLSAAGIGMSAYVAEYPEGFPGAAAAAPKQAAVFAAGMILIMASMGLYQVDLWDSPQTVKVRLLVAFLIGAAIVGLVWYLAPGRYPELVALGTTAIAIALSGSLIARGVFRRWNKLRAFRSRVLVLGTGSRVTRLAELGEHHPNHEIVGYIGQRDSRPYVLPSRILPMGSDETLLSLARRYGADQIVVGVRERRNGKFPIQQLLECRANGIKVLELTTFFEREHRQVMLESLNPSWMVLGEGFRRGALRETVKRLFDLSISLLLLVACAPVLLLAAMAVVLESGGPVLYRQERIGRDRRPFTVYKLRTMRQDAESAGTPRWASADDARATRVGRALRKTHIDELPQIFNVLKGEMSFVGPRPERPAFVAQLEQQIPYYALRHSVNPGITGWAQVRYAYGASVDDAVEKLQHDLYYVKNHSLFLDVMILLATVEVVLWGKGAR